MNRLLPLTFVLATLGATLGPTLAGCKTAGPRPDARGDSSTTRGSEADDARQAVTDLLEQYRQALLAGDAAALDRIWADDLIFTNARGEVLTKAQRLANLRSGATALRSVDVTDQLVRPLGPAAALATSRVTIDGQYGGQEGAGAYRTTTTWSRRGGRWQMVAVQMTAIAE